MDTAHRRIELQAPADLAYLMNNATRAARAKLDLHFPPSAAPESGDDAMKKRVEELVDQVSFELSLPICASLPVHPQNLSNQPKPSMRQT